MLSFSVCADVSGLAVNWEDEIVFWSDMNLGHIMYSQLDGRYHAFLLTGLVKPKALAIDPVEGYFATLPITMQQMSECFWRIKMRLFQTHFLFNFYFCSLLFISLL